jgi:uncharacterized protein (TIGR00299 family) protein
MRIGYFDCFAGVSGDMILGALLDAGLAGEVLQRRLDALHLPDFALKWRRVDKNGISASKVDVVVADEAHERHLPEIEAIVRQSDLDSHIKEQATAIFRRLGQAEARIHSTTPDHVHLHELGGVDTIVDVVGTLVGLEALGVERVYASPLPMARGFIQAAHGRIPLPAPATLALLKGVPVVGSELSAELVTPTGAALLSHLAADFGPLPAMVLEAVGYGAGTRDLAVPNVLRLLVGTENGAGVAITETLALLETNIDDLNPEFYEHVMARLFEAGALDVYLTPIQMKKNRPATLLSVLCRPATVAALSEILFAETSTLGVRQQTVLRRCLARSTHQVETPYGLVSVKAARWGEGQDAWRASPEYEDCRRLATEKGVPLREVYRAAEQAAKALGGAIP